MLSNPLGSDRVFYKSNSSMLKSHVVLNKHNIGLKEKATWTNQNCTEMKYVMCVSLDYNSASEYIIMWNLMHCINVIEQVSLQV